MTRPTPAALAFARSTLPLRRVASSSAATSRTQFASLVQNATTTATGSRSSALPRPRARSVAPATVHHAAMMTAGGPAPMSGAEILKNAEQLLNVPYVWGGTSGKGLDCSAFVSKAWGVSRQTTDTLASVSQPIAKDQLQAGDALNLTTARDADGSGHVRLFDRWANPEHTRMSVYEETPPKSVHHVINWDPAYQPMRRMNVTDS